MSTTKNTGNLAKGNTKSAATKKSDKLVKTYSAKPSEVTREWLVVDASEAPLGRVATEVAQHLIGKKKPMFTQHIDCGDFVIVVNTDNLVVTGNKLEDKKYYRHSQYPGSLKTTTLGDQMKKDSTAVIIAAVRGMLPKNKLMDERLKRLKVYGGSEHQHAAQKPKKVSVM
jgi:large subunit ribosomal protein L13